MGVLKMDQQKLEKMNGFKNIMVKHSHKIDLIIGLSLLIYAIYGYFNQVEYFWVAGLCGLLSLIMAVFKPVKKFDTYMNEKIITKTKK
jgi:hypothetical protein